MESRLLERAETALILLMLLGFGLIMQQWSFGLYQAGLMTVIVSTILNIAVSNVPRASRGWGLLRNLVLILSITAGVFGLGIVLVPFLATLGQ